MNYLIFFVNIFSFYRYSSKIILKIKLVFFIVIYVFFNISCDDFLIETFRKYFLYNMNRCEIKSPKSEDSIFLYFFLIFYLQFLY